MCDTTQKQASDEEKIDMMARIFNKQPSMEEQVKEFYYQQCVQDFDAKIRAMGNKDKRPSHRD